MLFARAAQNNGTPALLNIQQIFSALPFFGSAFCFAADLP